MKWDHILLAACFVFATVCVFFIPRAEALSFSSNASYEVCFTPGEDCTAKIVDTLNNAQKSILVMAYSFTSLPILEALLDAKKRGVMIEVILDKSQFKAEKYSVSKFLRNRDVPVWIDAKPTIAHNKVMIVDQGAVITGSFNFTRAAREKNAENVLIIQDEQLAQKYFENWSIRKKHSTILKEYNPPIKEGKR